MTNTIKGKVEAVSDRNNTDYFNIALGDPEQDGNWLIGNGSTDLEKGEEVEITHDDGSIENIKRTGGSGPNTGSRAGGASNSSTHLSKNQRITANTAVQLAAKKVPLENAESQGEHLEQVNALANGYRQIIEKQMDAMKQDNNEGESLE